MNGIPINMVMLLAAAIFVLGVVGVIIRKDVIFMLLSVEIMLNASGLAFIAAGAKWGQPEGQIMFIFILAMAAAEVSIGLALILQVYHQHKSLNIDMLKEMNG
jgi:NADH-quinone oxidoreductase subunit K